MDLLTLLNIIAFLVSIFVALWGLFLGSLTVPQSWQKLRAWSQRKPSLAICILLITNLLTIIFATTTLWFFWGTVRSLQPSSPTSSTPFSVESPSTVSSTNSTAYQLNSARNLSISCTSYNDGSNIQGNGCSKIFPIVLILKDITINQHPTTWHFTLTLAQEATVSCEHIILTNAQLTDETNTVYKVGGQEGTWHLSPGQSQPVNLTYDISTQPGKRYALNITIQACYTVTSYTTVNFAS